MASELEEAFLTWWCTLAPGGVQAPVEEYRFEPTRRWRADFAWPDSRVMVELEGGAWSGGRHTRGAGFEGDCTKYNRAVELGWKVFRYTAEMLKRDPAGVVEQVASAVLGLKR